jgi:hypothetical protein
MLLAAGFHMSRGEASSAAFALVLFVLAAFVAYARRSLVPMRAGGGALATG